MGGVDLRETPTTRAFAAADRARAAGTYFTGASGAGCDANLALLKGVPFVARRTLTKPFRLLMSTRCALEDSFAFCHFRYRLYARRIDRVDPSKVPAYIVCPVLCCARDRSCGGRPRRATAVDTPGNNTYSIDMHDRDERLYDEIRRGVISITRRTGERPTYDTVVRELNLTSQQERAVVRKLVSAGLVRPETTVQPNLIEEITGGIKRLLQREDLSDEQIVTAYREAFSRRIKAERTGLSGHTTAFLGVNTVLAVIWAITNAGFPWFLIPLFGWGIGYASHRASVLAREREYAELLHASQPPRGALRIHRAIWKARRKFWGHLTSNGMTIALLGTINLITWGGFPWALIPSGFIAVGIFAHRGRYRHQVAELTEQLIAAGGDALLPSGRVGGRGQTSARGDSGNNDPIKTARALRGEILKIVKNAPDATGSLGRELPAALDRYIGQIERLSKTSREIEELRSSIATEELLTERARLSSTLETLTDPRLKSEYERSIEQIDRHVKSAEDLASEEEILRLRTNTAVQGLQHIKIDITRAKTQQSLDANETLEELQRRSAELSAYVEDLRDAWDELA